MMNDRIELKATKLPEEISAIRCVVCARVSERPLMAATGEAEGEDIVICPRCLSEEWPLIKSDAEVDPERGKALAAALAKFKLRANL